MKLMAFFNRDGGTFKTTDMDAYKAKAEQVFSDAGHEIECFVVSGKEMMAAMEKGARRGSFDGMIAGGGDGTISAAASVAWKNGLALGVVPAGTMNLFARSLKLPLDIWTVLDVLANGRVEDVDIGSADGRAFVHQFSAGLHARMVRYRNSLSFGSRLGKISASTRAAVGVVFNPPEFEVEFKADGHTEHRRVSAISVSNNPFSNNSLMYAENLTGGQLGFYTAQPLRPLGVARLVVDILRGRMKENADITEMQVREIDLHFPKANGKINCVIDGELLPMGRNVALRLHPGALKVIVGSDQPDPPGLMAKIASVVSPAVAD